MMQQTHSLVVPGIVAAEKGLDRKPSRGEEAPDDHRPKDRFRPIGRDAENVRQVAVDFINETVVVPGLPGPEPLPTGPANKGAYENHGNAQDDETKKKSVDANLALHPGLA